MFCRRKLREGTGSALAVELAASTAFFAVFAVLGATLALIMYGGYINDRACRDAARAAAQGQTITEASKLADTILVSHKPSVSYIDGPRLKGSLVYEDYAGSPPAMVSPYVKLSTETKVVLPIDIFKFVLPGNTLIWRQTYTFPIVRAK